MAKKEGGYKVPDGLKKTCTVCGALIAKQGWVMHWKFKHAGEEFVSFEDAKGGKSTPQKPEPKKKKESEDKSFPGTEGGEGSGEGNTKRDPAWGDFDDW